MIAVEEDVVDGVAIAAVWACGVITSPLLSPLFYILWMMNCQYGSDPIDHSLEAHPHHVGSWLPTYMYVLHPVAA